MHNHNHNVYLDVTNNYLQNVSIPANSHLHQKIPASKPGLDPTSNRFHQPIVYHPNYSFSSWPPNHTFPMSKFYHTAQCLLQKQDHLPRPLVRSENDFYTPLDTHDIPYAWIAQPSGPIDAQYLESFLSSSLTEEQKRGIGFREQCDNPELIKRTLLEVSGTILTAHLAYVYGLATNVAGGTHHATQNMGRGYTILNDLAIASKYVLDARLNGGYINDVKRVLVIDCDVHQGDGTATFDLFANQHDTSIDKQDETRALFTLSLHCESNYPRYKSKST